jgi:hypothetical protein
MSLVAILLFFGTMALSLWATMRVRQVFGQFSRMPASSEASGAETAARILRQAGIYDIPSASITSSFLYWSFPIFVVPAAYQHHVYSWPVDVQRRQSLLRTLTVIHEPLPISDHD